MIIKANSKRCLYLYALFNPEMRAHGFPVLKEKILTLVWSRGDCWLKWTLQTFEIYTSTKRSTANVVCGLPPYLWAENVEQAVIQLLLHGFVEYLQKEQTTLSSKGSLQQSSDRKAGWSYQKEALTSINLDRIWGWIHRSPDRNAGSSLEANSVLTRVSSLETTNHISNKRKTL